MKLKITIQMDLDTLDSPNENIQDYIESVMVGLGEYVHLLKNDFTTQALEDGQDVICFIDSFKIDAKFRLPNQSK